MRWMRRLCTFALTASIATAVTVGEVSVTAAQAQAGPSITVDPIDVFNADGSATLTGTFDCGDSEGFAFIEANLSQPVGRVSTVSGSGVGDIAACAPNASGTWTALMVPSNGKFRGGHAVANARLVVDDDGMGIAETATPVKLRRRISG
jgi:hypothetical protein